VRQTSRILGMAAYALAESLVSVGGEGHEADGGKTWSLLLLLSAHLANVLFLLRLASPVALRILVVHYRGAAVLAVALLGIAYALAVGRLLDEAKNETGHDEMAMIQIRRWKLPVFVYLGASWASLLVALAV
jgi:hypothetical protein